MSIPNKNIRKKDYILTKFSGRFFLNVLASNLHTKHTGKPCIN